MELVSHIGLLPGQEVSAGTFLRKLLALVILSILLVLAITYQILVLFGVFAAIFLPHQIAAAKQKASKFYWAAAIAFMQLNRVKIKVFGDRILPESAVLMANHQSLADYVVLAYLAQTTSTTVMPRVSFFTWYSLWTMPLLKMWLNMAACDENWELTRPKATSMFRTVMTSETPEWVVVFPEVNIWTPTSAHLQCMQSQKYCLPQFDYMLYPRFSALFNATTEARTSGRNKYGKLYDVTISYEPQTPTLARLFSSSALLQVTVHIKSHQLLCIPLKRAKLERWLEKRWLEKDRRLKELRIEAGSTLEIRYPF